MSDMPGMTLREIINALNATYNGKTEDLEKSVKDVTMDSRQAGNGSLFICIKGERSDGHDYAAQVLEKGALAVICEHALDCNISQIIVENSVRALQELAYYYRTRITAKTVLITGSVGKTSTKEMIAAVLSEKFNVLKTIGNYNNEIGLPLTVLKIRPEHEVAVLEAGIDEPGEMDILGHAAAPDVCVITNIGICHLENLGSRQGIFDEKTKCFNYMQPGGVAVLNADNDFLGRVTEVKGATPVKFSMKGAGDITVTDIVDRGYDGSDAKLNTPAGAADIHVAIPGGHQLGNAAAAAAVGLHLGLTLEEIVKGIAAARTISGRTNLIRKDGYLVVDDCYNANPASMEAALKLLSHAEGRKLAVLGDMGELGPDEKELHRQVGRVAAENADVIFMCGSLAQEMKRGAEEAGAKDIRYFSDRDSLIEELKKVVTDGDTVLIKASHFMNFTKVVEALTA